MTITDRLRAASALMRANAESLACMAREQLEQAERFETLAAEIDAGPGLVDLTEVATALGISRDAAQKRVVRAGVGRTLAGRVWTPRRWLSEQLDAHRRG